MMNNMWIETFGEVESEIAFYVFCAVTGITAILGLVNIFMGCCVKGHSPGGSMDFYIALGAVLIDICVLIQGLNTDWAEESQFKTLCQMYPAALLLGLTMFVGGLMVKSWAIYAYFKWHAPHKAPVTEEWKPNAWIWLLIIIMAVCVVVWAVLFDTELLPSTHLATADNTVYQCKWENSYEWMISTSVWHGFLLLLAFVSLFANCCVNKAGRKVASSVSLVIVNTVAVTIAGLCVYYLADVEATVNYGIFGALLLWMCLFANIIFLITKSSLTCRGGEKESRPGRLDENYDTIKSDTSSKRADNMTYKNEQYDPEGGENFNY